MGDKQRNGKEEKQPPVLFSHVTDTALGILCTLPDLISTTTLRKFTYVDSGV